MWFNVNFHRLVALLLPTFLRKTNHISFLILFSTEMQDVHASWMVKRKRDLIYLNHNSQVYSLEKVLNDEFDNLDRRIKILDGVLYEPHYLWTIGEDDPLIIYQHDETPHEGVEDVYLYQNDDYEGGVDFYIGLPYQLNIDAMSIQITALVKRYKLASKRFKIINYE